MTSARANFAPFATQQGGVMASQVQVKQSKLVKAKGQKKAALCRVWSQTPTD
ncbi:MAG: hypothetical protein WC718_01845 [Phycisphaerales bacterium]|jgi:hypothetical protein